MAKLNFHHVNLHYIRAAIEKHTGIKLKMNQLQQYLIEENMMTDYQFHHLLHLTDQFMDKDGSSARQYVNIDPMPVDVVVTSNLPRDNRTGKTRPYSVIGARNRFTKK